MSIAERATRQGAGSMKCLFCEQLVEWSDEWVHVDGSLYCRPTGRRTACPDGSTASERRLEVVREFREAVR